MTDRAQFEAMLEALINEDQEAAKEIFHNIVVAKSREIYEELLESDFQEEGEMPAAPEAPMEEESEEDDTEEVGADDEDDSDEPADDAEGEENPFGDDEGGEEEDGEGELEDRVMDLEDALEDLKAEFEQLMAGEEGEEMGDMGAEPEMDMDMDMGSDDLEMEDPNMMMEYVNQHGGKTYNTFAKGGDDGVNTKSIVAGKNDMGGTAANIVAGGVAKGEGTQGGLANPKAGDLTSGLGTIHNRVNSNSGKTAFKKKETAKHGDNGQNTNSPLNGAPGRAK
jgi:hypothetical protein